MALRNTPHDAHGTDLTLWPAYYIVFENRTATAQQYSPIVIGAGPVRKELGTVPHLFDRDLFPVLPALWYCLHLPPTLFQLGDIPARGLKQNQAYDFAQRIVLMPATWFFSEPHLPIPDHCTPALVITPDSLHERALEHIAAQQSHLDCVKMSSLTSESLRCHWTSIHQRCAPTVAYHGREPILLDRLDSGCMLLPLRMLLRQFRLDTVIPLPQTREDMAALLVYTVEIQFLLSSVARLERERRSEREAEQLFERTLAEERVNTRIPLALAAAGSACPLGMLPHQDRDPNWKWPPCDETHTLSTLGNCDNDYHIERAVIECMVTHRAVARTGVGFTLPSIPTEAFRALRDLEDHCACARPRPRFVWHSQRRITDLVGKSWDDAIIGTLARGSMITAFSDFPIGLVTMYPGTAPLACRVPIAYRPLSPLTRALQMELPNPGMVYLGTQFHVLILECIDADTRVGRMARIGWRTAKEALDLQAGIRTTYLDIHNLADIRAAIQTHRPDILIPESVT